MGNKNYWGKIMNRIAVIYGGLSGEREISIRTKEAILPILKKLGKNYVALELNKELPIHLKAEKIDLVFNATHGQYGEDGRLAGLLDIMQIPYTHSNMKASQIAMNKLVTKKLISHLDIPTPKYALIDNINHIPNAAQSLMQKPFVLKPISEGSSLGVYVILKPEKFTLKAEHFSYGAILLEEYIAGQELNVAIINNKAIGLVEVKPKTLFYDYDAKYNSTETEYIIKPDLSDSVKDKLLLAGEKIHNYIGCNYLSRVEFMVKNDEIFFLEINTQPGFTERSLVPKVALNNGMNFSDIIIGLINSATYG